MFNCKRKFNIYIFFYPFRRLVKQIKTAVPTPFKTDNDEGLSELSTLDARLAESLSPRGQRQRFIFSLYGKDKPPDLDKHTELSDDEKYHICKLFMGPDKDSLCT